MNQRTLPRSSNQEVLATMPISAIGYAPALVPTTNNNFEFDRTNDTNTNDLGYSVKLEDTTLSMNLFGDVLVGCGVTFTVAPFMYTVDKAIVQRAAGTHTITSSMSESVRTMMRNPVSFVKSPVFLMMWGVYAATYCTANCLKTVNEHYNSDESLSKWSLFVGATAVNSGTTMIKDRAYATMFGTAGAASRVPLVTFGLWGLRDCMVIGSSFLLPDLVGSMLQDTTQMNKTDSTRFAQMFCPIATQLLAGPIQLLGLDFYNRPMKDFSLSQASTERIRFIGKNFFSILGARIARIAPAYGIGGIGNTYFRDKWRSNVKTFELSGSMGQG